MLAFLFYSPLTYLFAQRKGRINGFPFFISILITLDVINQFRRGSWSPYPENPSILNFESWLFGIGFQFRYIRAKFQYLNF